MNNVSSAHAATNAVPAALNPTAPNATTTASKTTAATNPISTTGPNPSRSGLPNNNVPAVNTVSTQKISVDATEVSGKQPQPTVKSLALPPVSTQENSQGLKFNVVESNPVAKENSGNTRVPTKKIPDQGALVSGNAVRTEGGQKTDQINQTEKKIEKRKESIWKKRIASDSSNTTNVSQQRGNGAATDLPKKSELTQQKQVDTLFTEDDSVSPKKKVVSDSPKAEKAAANLPGKHEIALDSPKGKKTPKAVPRQKNWEKDAENLDHQLTELLKSLVELQEFLGQGSSIDHNVRYLHATIQEAKAEKKCDQKLRHVTHAEDFYRQLHKTANFINKNNLNDPEFSQHLERIQELIKGFGVEIRELKKIHGVVDATEPQLQARESKNEKVKVKQKRPGTVYQNSSTKNNSSTVKDEEPQVMKKLEQMPENERGVRVV